MLPLVITVAGAWLLMRSLGTGHPDQAQTGGGKVLYYKSTMMLGEISQTSRKDSMGMDMVPVAVFLAFIGIRTAAKRPVCQEEAKANVHRPVTGPFGAPRSIPDHLTSH